MPALEKRMKKQGWRRRYSIPAVHVVPGYFEAKEEAERDLQAEERRMAQQRQEAQRELTQAVREELGE